ncbi:single-strand DNA endonuclease 1 isoform X2 [Quercus suber]|uniref:single-strand DNA endonuclease 1 isoform X2 n=1 Tax=Quercus suber TaxID=58331 RepID=UPI0032DF704A
MVQLHNVSKSHSCMKEKVYLRGLFHRLRALIAVNCTIVFVTDRSIPAIKLSTYRRRLNSRSEDGCYTLDSDVFLFGERTVYGICLGDGGYVICYEMTDVERRLGFGRNSLEVSMIHKGMIRTCKLLMHILKPKFASY